MNDKNVQSLAEPMQSILDGAMQFLEHQKDQSSEKIETAKEIIRLLEEGRFSTIMMMAKQISKEKENPTVIELLINGCRFFFVEDNDMSPNFFFTKIKP